MVGSSNASKKYNYYFTTNKLKKSYMDLIQIDSSKGCHEFKRSCTNNSSVNLSDYQKKVDSNINGSDKNLVDVINSLLEFPIIMTATTTDATSVELFINGVANARLPTFTYPYFIKLDLIRNGSDFGAMIDGYIFWLAADNTGSGDWTDNNHGISTSVSWTENQGIWYIDDGNGNLKLYVKGDVGNTLNWKIIINQITTI